MSIVITSGVKLENIQNEVVLGRKMEVGNFAQVEKFVHVQIFLQCANFRAVYEFSRMLEIALHFWLPAILFLHFCLPNFEGDQPGSFMHGLTR